MYNKIEINKYYSIAVYAYPCGKEMKGRIELPLIVDTRRTKRVREYEINMTNDNSTVYAVMIMRK